jgi:hypothetical protein
MRLLEKVREVIKAKHRKIYTASRYLAELAGSNLLHESRVGKYHLYANRNLLQLLKRQQ